MKKWFLSLSLIRSILAFASPIQEPYEWSYHIQLNPSAITHLADACIHQLITSSIPHRETIRHWVVEIYKAHDIHLSEERGGHMMDVLALEKADELLNPVLLKEMKRLIPYSKEADSLYTEAVTQDKPLSKLVFQIDSAIANMVVGDSTF